jgi:2-keto-3-deoxy-L-rhamnonate aldolase RhmA
MTRPVLRPNRLREQMRKGKPTIGTHILSSWPGIVEAIGNSNMVDYIEFSASYAPFDLYALENMARASELYDMSMMIKIDPIPSYFLAQRAIGAGIQNVLFSDFRTIEEVQDAILAVRPEPEGRNGCWMHRVEGYSLECGTKNFVKYANDVVLAIMLEKVPLYEKIEELLNLDGVDMIQWGPCDMAMSMGIHSDYSNPKLLEAEDRAIKLSLKYDKHPRVELSSDFLSGRKTFEKSLNSYIKKGVQDFCIGWDVVILMEWMKEYAGTARKALKMD